MFLALRLFNISFCIYFDNHKKSITSILKYYFFEFRFYLFKYFKHIGYIYLNQGKSKSGKTFIFLLKSSIFEIAYFKIACFCQKNELHEESLLQLIFFKH